MRYLATSFPLLACGLMVALMRPATHAPSNALSGRPRSFEEKLNLRVEHFNARGQTLIASVLDLAYEYELPTAIEYIDHDAASRPLGLEFHGESVRGIVLAIIQQVPEYRVSFSDGLIDIYAPKAREDSSNLLTKVIKNFAVTDSDTHEADMELFCALSREVEPKADAAAASR